MPSKVYRSKGTKLQVSIASTLTTVVGLKDFSFGGMDNEMIEEAGLEDEYPVVIPSDTVTVGTGTAAVIWDPLDATQQFLHAAKNDKTEVTGNIIWGNTGVEEPCKFYVEKFERKAERTSGLMADLAIKFTEKIDLNEADPE